MNVSTKSSCAAAAAAESPPAAPHRVAGGAPRDGHGRESGRGGAQALYGRDQRVVVAEQAGARLQHVALEGGIEEGRRVQGA